MLMIGKSEYSSCKPYIEVNTDFSTVNSDLHVEEAVFEKIESGYILKFKASKMTDVMKDAFKESELYYLIFHTSEYTRWTKENPKSPTQPQLLEKVISGYFETEAGKEILGKPFKAEITLTSAESYLNKVVKLEAYDMLLDKFELLEEAPSLVDATFQAAKGKGYSAAKTESELEKLNGRLGFVSALLGDTANDAKLPELVAVITELQGETAAEKDVFWKVLNLLVGANIK